MGPDKIRGQMCLELNPLTRRGDVRRPNFRLSAIDVRAGPIGSRFL